MPIFAALYIQSLFDPLNDLLFIMFIVVLLTLETGISRRKMFKKILLSNYTNSIKLNCCFFYQFDVV